MITISEHARESMEYHGISEEEIKSCLKYGKLIIKQFIKGEMRYGMKIELKYKIIIVIYTIKNRNEMIVTTYPIRRKKW